jgi:hypothetical protein
MSHLQGCIRGLAPHLAALHACTFGAIPLPYIMDVQYAVAAADDDAGDDKKKSSGIKHAQAHRCVDEMVFLHQSINRILCCKWLHQVDSALAWYRTNSPKCLW